MDNEVLAQKVTEHDVRIDVLEKGHTELKKEVKTLQDMNVSMHDMLGEMKAMRIDTNAKIDSLDGKFDGLAENVTKVQKGLSEVDDKVTALEAKPDKEEAKSYKAIKNMIITAFLAGIIGFILAQLFPNIF